MATEMFWRQIVTDWIDAKILRDLYQIDACVVRRDLEDLLSQVGIPEVFLVETKPLRLQWSESQVSISKVTLERMTEGPYPINLIFPSSEIKNKFMGVVGNPSNHYQLLPPIEIQYDALQSLFIYRLDLKPESQPPETGEVYISALVGVNPVTKARQFNMNNLKNGLRNSGLEEELSAEDFYIVSSKAIYRFTLQREGYEKPTLFLKKIIKNPSSYLPNLARANTKGTLPIIFFLDLDSRIEFETLARARGFQIKPSRTYQNRSGTLVSYSVCQI